MRCAIPFKTLSTPLIIERNVPAEPGDVFVKLDSPREIVLARNWENEGRSEVEELVTVRFSADEVGTSVVVTLEVDDAAGDPEPLRQGWKSVLGRLA